MKLNKISKNLKNNQNYILWKDIKNKIISSFLSYKKNESYFKEKNPLISMMLDSISDFIIFFLNFIYSFLNKTLKINTFFAILIIIVIYTNITFFLIYIIIMWKQTSLLIFLIILLFVYIRSILIFSKSKLDLSNFIITIKKPFSWFFVANYYKQTVEKEIWYTKDFIIKKNKKNYNDELYKLIILFLILLFLFITSYIIIHKYIDFKKSKIQKKQLIENIFIWNELFDFEKKILYKKLIVCYKSNYPYIDIKKSISDINFPKDWIIKDICEDTKTNEIKKILMNRSNYTKEDILYIVNSESNNLYLKENIDTLMKNIFFYKYSIIYHNNLYNFN